MLATGSILGGKLRLDRLVSTGANAEVFQGRDLSSGQRVAVKVLRLSHADQLARFEREVRTLAELDHPNIVRYLDHAVTLLGQPYLVTEWLDGEDLATRLRTRPLTARETLAIGQDVAEAMAAAHERGILHRDLKPGNVFLMRGEFGPSKVLDFGIAGLRDGTSPTQPSAMIATPSYVVPEQARSPDELTPAADVFALGCLLFECLAGTSVVAGERSTAMMGPHVPVELAQLIERMLARDPDQRPRDGAVVRAALAAVAALHMDREDTSARPSGTRQPSLTRDEQHLLAVVLVAPGPVHGPTDPADPRVSAGVEPTELAGLRRAAEAHGGYSEVRSDGSVLVAISSTQLATDQAALAARCALALRAGAPGSLLVLAIGRGDGSARAPGRDIVDRAAGKLAQRLASAPGDRGCGDGTAGPPPIWIDDVVAGLLDRRFDVRETEAGFELHGERVIPGTRRLLGRPTSCVGRDRELASLARQFACCVGESTAHAVLVTAPAGLGKSRFAAELMTLIEERHERVVFWIARGDALRGGSAFGLLCQALQRALGLRDGDPLAAQQDTLRARVARHVPEADRRRVTEFLGELLGTPFPDDDSAPLRAARHEPEVMSEQMRRAAEDFLRAECSAHPVVLVLEDLQWGDLPTVRFVDAALRDLEEQPWMVLALARPDVHKRFPRLWSMRPAQELRLRQLPRSASEQLVRQVLGEEVAPATVARLVAQAEGNPFYLEELIRALAEHGGEALPETLVAMVHTRLGRLVEDERRVLRVASVFGEVFWPAGVAALLGGALPAPAIDAWLETLVERELIVRNPDSRFTGLPEFSFRHALLREGAYAMLTAADRVVGHRLAAAWLEHQGESDPLVLAQHHERGEEPSRAGRSYFQSAERAIRAGDLDAAAERARRALGHGLPDAEQVASLGLLSEVSIWRGEWDEATRSGEQALRLAAPGTHPWGLALSAKMAIVLREGKLDAFLEVLRSLLTVEPARDAIVDFAAAINFATLLLSTAGRFGLVEHCLRRLHAIVEPVAPREPVARGWMQLSHVAIEPWAREDPWAGLQYAEAARASFLEAHHHRNVRLAQLMVGMNLWFLGALEAAERELRGAMEGGALHGPSAARHLFCFAGTLADRGALDEAQEVASRRIEAWQAQGLRIFEGQGRRVLADVLYRRGELAAAEREVRTALELLALPTLEPLAAKATLAAVLLAQGRAPEALATAAEVMAQYAALGAFGFRGAFARLVHAEALEATGDHAGACRAVATARDCLQIQAARIGDPDLRRGFLEDLPENARTVALARQWLGDHDPASD